MRPNRYVQVLLVGDGGWQEDLDTFPPIVHEPGDDGLIGFGQGAIGADESRENLAEIGFAAEVDDFEDDLGFREFFSVFLLVLREPMGFDGESFAVVDGRGRIAGHEFAAVGTGLALDEITDGGCPVVVHGIEVQFGLAGFHDLLREVRIHGLEGAVCPRHLLEDCHDIFVEITKSFIAQREQGAGEFL